jgi:hypothetical protein
MSQRTADRTGEGVRGDIAGEEWWMEPSTQCVLGDQMSNDGELGTRPKARADNRSRGIPRGQRGTTDFHMPLLRIHRCLMSPNPVRRSTCTSYKVRYGTCAVECWKDSRYEAALLLLLLQGQGTASTRTGFSKASATSSAGGDASTGVAAGRAWNSGSSILGGKAKAAAVRFVPAMLKSFRTPACTG